MEKDFWLKKWKIGDIAFHQQDVNPYLIHFFNQLNLKKDERILVPLCGKTRDMLWLANQGYKVLGIDLSPIACQDFFAELNVKPNITETSTATTYQYQNIELICGDFLELSPKLLSSHAIYDCKALVALPPDSRKKYVNHLIACLKPNAKILLIAMESPDVVKGPPFPVHEAEINELYGAALHVQKIKHEFLTNIPEHLVKKGYQEIVETVYLISNK